MTDADFIKFADYMPTAEEWNAHYDTAQHIVRVTMPLEPELPLGGRGTARGKAGNAQATPQADIGSSEHASAESGELSSEPSQDAAEAGINSNKPDSAQPSGDQPDSDMAASSKPENEAMEAPRNKSNDEPPTTSSSNKP
jgi:hypothetical protein